MTRLLSILLAAVPLYTRAQHTLTVQIAHLPDTHSGDDIFITGNFNKWQPAEENMRLQKKENGHYELTVPLINVPSDRLEFKFTRGSWKTLECTPEGKLVGPRLATLDKDSTIVCQIAGWRDDYPESTASPNVHLLDSAFYIPQLDQHRKVWIYLPVDYAVSQKSYPVIYMHDGQDLFDEATSQGRTGPIEWAVDDVIDTAAEKAIVVAVDHHPDMKERVKEYTFRAGSKDPDARGAAYLDFVVSTLKPYVDQHYRTLPDQQHTAMAGSSLGGLLTLYAGIHYPETFGLLGVFSPSVWQDGGHIENELTNLTNIDNIRLQHYYFYAGKNENRLKPDGSFVQMHDDAMRVKELLREKASPRIQLSINPEGRHGALHWREAFPAFYAWFIANSKAN